MKKSFMERIFPHSPGSTLPQYEYDTAVSPRSPRSPPHIRLQDSIASSSPSGNVSSASSRRLAQSLNLSPLRHNDPFLPVERAAHTLEQTLQGLLDAQSEGLLAGVGTEPTEDTSSMGSATPTPSTAISSRREGGLETTPIRQPKRKKTTLREARRGLARSMAEFSALKDWELTLIDGEVRARDNALRQAADLGNRTQLLNDEIEKIQAEGVAVGLRSEAQKVEQEIMHLEATLFELKARHRQLLNQVGGLESSKESKLSSYREALALNEGKVKHFVHQPPVSHSLSKTPDPGMYALKPERRTLRMAHEQWTSELDMLNLQRSDVENEKRALDEGSALWREVIHRIREFEKELRAQTRHMSQSSNGDALITTTEATATATTPSPTTTQEPSMGTVVSKLTTLTAYLTDALTQAESKNWNLLICSIGAELAAFEQARDMLLQKSEDGSGANGTLLDEPPITESLVDDQHQDGGPDDDFTGAGFIHSAAAAARPQTSPAQSSNHSLEDTLREFENGLDKGKQRAGEDHQGLLLPDLGALPNGSSGFGPEFPTPTTARSRHNADPTSESEDDDPGPDFFLSHS